MSASLAQIGTADLLAEIERRRVAETVRQLGEALKDRGDVNADDWLDSTEAAIYLRLSRDRLGKLASAGHIPSEQEGPGCKRYFRRSALDRWREFGGAPVGSWRSA